jgi:hypothetical protein
LRDHHIDRPSTEPASVPSTKPMMVDRNVKPMSTKASPCPKKISSVVQIALGRDQKNGSITL